MCFRISSGCRAGAWPASGERRQPQRLPYKQNAIATALRDERRSVSEKARLQDQFSERKCARWAGVEEQGRNRPRGIRDERARLNRKIRIAEFRVIACPTLCFRKNNGAQDFAALHLRGLFLLFRRLGMEWTVGLRLISFRCDRGERAMIRDRDPRNDRNRDADATYVRFHTAFNRRTTANSQIFSCESRIGATVPEVTPSGGTTSGISVADCSANRGCWTRVAITAAVNRSAAARK
jgi:hypothetical protein